MNKVDLGRVIDSPLNATQGWDEYDGDDATMADLLASKSSLETKISNTTEAIRLLRIEKTAEEAKKTDALGKKNYYEAQKVQAQVDRNNCPFIGRTSCQSKYDQIIKEHANRVSNYANLANLAIARIGEINTDITALTNDNIDFEAQKATIDTAVINFKDDQNIFTGNLAIATAETTPEALETKRKQSLQTNMAILGVAVVAIAGVIFTIKFLKNKKG